MEYFKLVQNYLLEKANISQEETSQENLENLNKKFYHEYIRISIQ